MLFVSFLYERSWYLQESDLQKTIYPARLNSMDMLPSSSLTGLGEVPSTTDLFMRGRLAKLELSDGNNVYAKLVVGVSQFARFERKPFLNLF